MPTQSDSDTIKMYNLT